MRPTRPGLSRAVCAAALAACLSCGEVADPTATSAADVQPDAPATFGAALAKQRELGLATPGTLSLSDGLTLEIQDLGRGPAALLGDELLVHLRVASVIGAEMENTFSTGRPMKVVLGTTSIIPGLERALDGMPVGTRAVARVPSELAYGDRPPPATVGKDADLLVDIQLMKVR